MRKLLTPRNLALIIGVLVLMIGSAVVIKGPFPDCPACGSDFPPRSFHCHQYDHCHDPGGYYPDRAGDCCHAEDEGIPRGGQNILEWFVEIFDNLNEDIAGKAQVKKFFPIFMTILMFLLVANWMSLVPGVDSIGKLEPLEYAYKIAGMTTGYKTVELPLGIRSSSCAEGMYTLTAEDKAKTGY